MAQKAIPMETKLAALFALDAADLVPNVSELCRDLQISRQTYYKYRRRVEGEGVSGLAPRSRRPRSSPTATPAEMVAAILAARHALEREGWDFGAISIRYRLLFNGLEPPSTRTIHRVLTRNGEVEPAPQKRPRSSLRRFQFPASDDCWQIDAFDHHLADGSPAVVFQLLDDFSRFELDSLAWPVENTAGAWECLSRAMRVYGRPRMVLSDNGLAFTGRFLGNTVLFENNLRLLGIHTIHSRSGHPQTCGKDERVHRTTQQWLGKRQPPETLEQLQALLDEYRPAYNARPHQSLDGSTPRDRRLAGIRHSPPQSPLAPVTLVNTCRSDARGTIKAGGCRIPLGAEFSQLPVTVFKTGLHMLVFHREHLVRELNINPALGYQPLTRPDGRSRIRTSQLSAMS